MLHYTLTLPPGAEPDQAVVVAGCHEILVEHRQLARTGRLTDDELECSRAAARACGLKAVLVWDLLVSDEEIAAGMALLHQWDMQAFDAVRVQDPGLAAYLRDRFPRLPLQLVLETGNHNLAGIGAWVRHLRPQRVVLSNELPLDLLADVRAAVDIELEVQALGRLLIFYSPRGLMPDEEGALVERFAVDPGPGKKFPVLRNAHGTFMYYEKDLFLLPWRGELARAGVDFARLDLKSYTPAALDSLADYLRHEDPPRDHPLKTHLAPKLTRGFLKSNRTDKQFVRLKNPNLLRRDEERYAGTVLETRKRKYIALLTERPLRQGDVLVFQLPEGDRVTHPVTWLRDSEGRAVNEASTPGLWLLNPVARVSSGAIAYLAGPGAAAD